VDGAIARYLDVFVPWVATVVLGHFILRSSTSPLITGSGLASRAMLVRVLVATTVAIGIIVSTDLLTGGDLFLRPRFPSSQLLAGVIAVTGASVALLARTLQPVLRRVRRP
jgi:hypothetical protein